jgi:hypothetical protein
MLPPVSARAAPPSTSPRITISAHGIQRFPMPRAYTTPCSDPWTGHDVSMVAEAPAPSPVELPGGAGGRPVVL